MDDIRAVLDCSFSLLFNKLTFSPITFSMFQYYISFLILAIVVACIAYLFHYD